MTTPKQATLSSVDPQLGGLLGTLQRDRPRLLMVDDQPSNIQILYRLFRDDHQVFMATGGVQAIETCEKVLPDLVLLDVVMPDLDGIEVCRRLKANQTTAHIPVVFVTAHHEPAEEERGLDAGAVDFIAKPIHPRLVRARVRNHLISKLRADVLQDWARHDALTGLFNRRHFDELLTTEFSRSVRTGTALSLILVDIDHFKLYNDHYGHPTGDSCLQQVAAVLRLTATRPADVVARYGGEEFACILPDTDRAGALAVAERIHKLLREAAIEHSAQPSGDYLSLSIGVATRDLDSTATATTDLLALADSCLYRAKDAGRNRTESAALG